MNDFNLGLKNFFSSKVIVKGQHFVIIIWVSDCASNPIAVSKFVDAVVKYLRAYIPSDASHDYQGFFLGEKRKHSLVTY